MVWSGGQGIVGRAELASNARGESVVSRSAFGVHVLFGGAYEMRTVGAMALRSLVWIVIAIVARQTMRAPKSG